MPSLELEQSLRLQGYRWVVGVDEAGRGPLAGPVVAGAVVLPQSLDYVPDWLAGVDDSKKLTARQRRFCLDEIRLHAIAIGVGVAEREEIDSIGIGDATRLALRRAIDNLLLSPDYVLADYVPLFDPGVPFQTLKGGRRALLLYSRSLRRGQGDPRPDHGRRRPQLPRLRILAPQGIRYSRAPS